MPPVTVTPCPVCGAPILKARLADGSRIVLDAEPCAEGEWAAWLHRDGLNWIHHARHESQVDRMGGRFLRRPHACAGPAGQQLEIGAA